jgi:phosphatidylserine decarboxylase
MPNLSPGERVVRTTWRLAPKWLISRAIGWGARRELPRPLQTSLLRTYAKAYKVDTREAEHPIEKYASLQAFFTRRLAAGLRPMPDDEHVVVAPSDGTVCEAGLATAGKLLEAKGSLFTLRDLLADDALAASLEGGPYVAIYLSPRDYHRVHFPMCGKVLSWSHIPGKLFPVGDRSVRREPGLFARNERFVTVIDGPAGRCAIVMVAAIGVGHITADYDAAVATHAGGFATGTVRRKTFATGPVVACGQELGIFNLGSTTVTIFEPGRVELREFLSNAPIKMGVPVGRILPR